jgi:hypothetical protein
MKLRLSNISVRWVILPLVATQLSAESDYSDRYSSDVTLGKEVSITRHLSDGEEFSQSISKILAHGERLFRANWTTQEGGGRPLTKGTGNPLSDPKSPLVFPRNFNRISGPDANSCAGCHNNPLPGGCGDIVANVFVTGQRFDFASFDSADRINTKGSLDERGKGTTLQSIANSRATPGMFGSGYLEMVARQMTADLQAQRDATPKPGTNALVSKGVSFGKIVRTKEGRWDVSQVTGLPAPSLDTKGGTVAPDLIIRPMHQAGNVVSIRQFSNNAFNHHHGIQAAERFGPGADPDGDGYRDELTRADITAASAFQAAMAVPGRVIPDQWQIERAVLNGENRFVTIGCAKCHVPNLPLTQQGWIYTEPNPYNPVGNLRPGEAPTFRMDLNSSDLPKPRLKSIQGTVYVPAFTDLKLHDITTGSSDPNREVIDMNQPAGSTGFFAGNSKFLTRKLWGLASKPNFFHHGLYTTIREATEAHAGEAKASRDAYMALSKYDQDSVIEFLKTLRLLPPGTSSLFVDEDGKAKQWPPSWSYKFTSVLTSSGGPTLSGMNSEGGTLRMLLTWPGDSGLYSPPRLAQLQTASDLSGAQWINLGEPTAALSTEVEFGLEGNGFFRLLPVDE